LQWLNRRPWRLMTWWDDLPCHIHAMHVNYGAVNVVYISRSHAFVSHQGGTIPSPPPSLGAGGACPALPACQTSVSVMFFCGTAGQMVPWPADASMGVAPAFGQSSVASQRPLPTHIGNDFSQDFIVVLRVWVLHISPQNPITWGGCHK